MSLFKKIGQLLLGESETPRADTWMSSADNIETSQAEKRTQDAVDTRQRIKKSTLSLLDSLYLSDSDSCESKRLVVWLDTDHTTFNAYSGFEQDLRDYWSVERGYVFASVELKQGKPENDGRKLDIQLPALKVYLQEIVPEMVIQHVVKKARVSVYGNKGSLIQSQYELSSEVLESEHRSYYNIGRGEFPDMDGKGYRQNHIAIDDVNNLDTNKFVSRAHARIGFSDKIGFFLQVEYGGSRLSGNRTRIFRGEEKIEVENIEVKEPLQMGDLIELGKAVVLKFVEIE